MTRWCEGHKRHEPILNFDFTATDRLGRTCRASKEEARIRRNAARNLRRNAQGAQRGPTKTYGVLAGAVAPPMVRNAGQYPVRLLTDEQKEKRRAYYYELALLEGWGQRGCVA